MAAMQRPLSLATARSTTAFTVIAILPTVQRLRRRAEAASGEQALA